MNSKRHEVQEFVEFDLKCFDVSQFGSYKSKLVDWKVSSQNITGLKSCMHSDLNSYYFKALQTFIQAVHEIKQEKYTWAIIKLYYSTFYMLRCEILLANYILIRCNSLFYTKVEEESKLKPFNIKSAKGDHQLTISFSKKLYDDCEINDPIFGNLIDNENAYTWLMKNRERVNYQTKDFPDPKHDEVLNHIMSYFKDDNLIELFEFYNKSTDYSICFDLDHSILSIPYKKLIQIHNKIKDKIDFNNDFKRKIISCFGYASELNINRKQFYLLLK